MPKKTAFLVVHGIGQQNKYETLASFAAGLTQVWKTAGKPMRHVERVEGGGVESVLSLRGQDGRLIEIYEYYYQPALQRSVGASDVIGFIFSTIVKVRKLYDRFDFGSKRKELARRSAANQPLSGSTLPAGYLLRPQGASLLAGIMGLGACGVHFLWRSMPAPLKGPVEWLASHLVQEYVIEIFGDVVAYLSIDPNSRLNSKREQILAGCAARIQDLLAKAEGGKYDQVVIAAHSLGSVVAYDALSRIAREAVCDSAVRGVCRHLKGLVTFGSPLDKVAFMFWPFPDAERGEEWDVIQNRFYGGMLPHFYGMRSSPLMNELHHNTVAQQPTPAFDHLHWVNYYCDRDLIGGHLDAYDGVCNRHVGAYGEVRLWNAIADHTSYWASQQMFMGIVGDFILDSPWEVPPEWGGTPAAPEIAAEPIEPTVARPTAGRANGFFKDRDRPLILGHRGMPLRHQENTLAAFRAALSLGVDGVEFDVFKTTDNKIVVFHDEETERLTGVKGNITEMSWDEVSKLRIRRKVDMGAGRVVTFPGEQRIPLLEEVLDEFKGKLLMNIEMKAYAPHWARRHTGTETARVIRRCGAESSVILTSFDFFMLWCLENEYPGLESGFAYDDGMMDNQIGEWFRRVPEIATDLSKVPGNQNDISFLNFIMESDAVGKAIGSTLVDAEYTLIDSDTVAKFHSKGMRVGAYTTFPLDTRFVRYPNEDQNEVVRRLVEHRVDWIETDDPERMLEIFAGKPAQARRA